jgi:hypothetical protein
MVLVLTTRFVALRSDINCHTFGFLKKAVIIIPAYQLDSWQDFNEIMEIKYLLPAVFHASTTHHYF